MVVKKQDKKQYDFWITLLKGATAALIVALTDSVIQSINGGVDIKQSVIIGVGVGLVAAVKNVLKFVWNIDLDLSKLKKSN